MLISLLILIVLAIGTYGGARKGIALEAFYLFGYALTFLIAKLQYAKVGPKFELLIPYPSVTTDSNLVFFSHEISLKLDQAFYAAFAFMLILFIGWLLIHFVGIFADALRFTPIPQTTDWIGGGVIAFINTYLVIFMVLWILSLVPLDSTQNIFRHSGLARLITQDTPHFSKEIYRLWITNIVK
ncbi:MAG: CvpA family protein [Enterococcaceae bacterium]|jgi:uncharacterized membrane protein required for colicin V production|nr:CvpA family protein [Enterococcaceae bacterium]MCI1919196.1 CvpA family protein [Enterococcaceae bacterium]